MKNIPSPQTSLSVVIPMYNELDNVEPLINEVIAALSQHPHFEIIVADDGSNDGTYEKLLSLQKSIPELRVLRHKGNFGQSAGVVTGVRAANNEWIATLDGDGQNNPADIPDLMSAATSIENHDKPILIAGNRGKRDDTWFKRKQSKIANAVRGWLLKDDCPDTGCGLKLFPKRDFLKLPHFNHVHRFMPALFKRNGGKIVNVVVSHRPRTRGTSKYGMWNRLWVGIVDMFGVVWLIRRPCMPEIENDESA